MGKYIKATEPDSISWVLDFHSSPLVRVRAFEENITTFNDVVKQNVGDIQVSTDNIAFEPLTIPFTPVIGTYYFTRSDLTDGGLLTINQYKPL